jgi:hypothetical protein
LGGKQGEAQAEITLVAGAQGQGGGVVHHARVAGVVGEGRTAHAAGFGAIGFQVHAVGSQAGFGGEQAQDGGQEGAGLGSQSVADTGGVVIRHVGFY